MRTPGWSLATLLLIAPALSAQQQPPARGTVPVQQPPARAGMPPQLLPARGGAPTQPAPIVPPAPAPDPRLDPLLQQWAQKMKSIDMLEAQVVRREKDSLAKTEDIYDGLIRFQRPDRADLYLVKRTNPPQNPKDIKFFERFLCTGQFLYEYKPENKLIRAHELPRRAPGQPLLEDNFLSFLFGMEAQEVKRRYDLQLVKQDAHYEYLLVKPRLAADKVEFIEAQLVLFNKAQGQNAFLPRQMTLIQPNNNETKWEIPTINPAAQIPATYFQKPALPPGWQFANVPLNAAPPAPLSVPRQGGAAPPPTVIRQSGGK